MLILTYGCSETGHARAKAVLSREHRELRWFPLTDVAGRNRPAPNPAGDSGAGSAGRISD